MRLGGATIEPTRFPWERMQVPTLDTELLLDVLLGLIVLLFVPFGVRRGVAKEVMVSAGILFGTAVADRWAVRGGAEVADRFGLAEATARFVVAAVCLGVGALVLGYGGGAALGRLRQGIMARLTGGLVAAGNGALLVALVLDFLRRYLRGGRDLGAVDDGYLGRTLLRDFDWLLLGAAAGLALVVVLGWIVTGFRRRNEPVLLPSADGPGIPPRQRPARLPRGGDTGKYEPDEGPPPPESRPGRFGGSGGAASLGQTTPLLDRPEPWRPPDEPDRGVSWPRPRASFEAEQTTNGHHPTPAGTGDWLRRGSGTLPLDRPAPGDAPGDVAEDDRAWRPPRDRPAAESDERRCPTCGATLGRHDLFCAECGTTL